jgi:ankyrin repeat protein
MKNASSKIPLLLLFAVAFLFAGCAKNTLIVDEPKKDDANIVDAARKGDMKEIERLIAAGADVNMKGPGNRTALHYVAAWGRKEDAELLISKGADVNAKDGNGQTPLHNAAYSGRKGAVEPLISKGADLYAKDNKGKTPLDIATSRGHRTFVVTFYTKTEPSNPADEAAFTEVARSYRTATVKPTLPEEARKFKVQAEYAFSKKDFDGAVARYKEALDVAPWWPEGHFNRALILGELSRYRDAIREMKKYLMLVPDAPNARTAQDNIYRWESGLK